ncbi:MAG: hypothetical protein JNJ44_11610 [Zoogloeaceae bacterium]|nr:hypothetical protein [Zoogloeaceae bacterium]
MDTQDAEPATFNTQLELCKERQRTEALRLRYVDAVVEESQQKSVVNTMLMGVGGVAGYHLLKHGLGGGTGTLRYLAAGGGALYGYGTLIAPQARQLLYLTGAEALTCIHAASGELQIPPTELRGFIDAQCKLRKAISTLQSAPAQRYVSARAQVGGCRIRGGKAGACTVGAKGVGKALFEVAPPKGCADQPASDSCRDEFARSARLIEPEVREAQALLAQIQSRLDEIGRLSRQIRPATDTVSYGISREVLKTEASPAAVVSTFENMRGVVSQLMGTAQSGPKFTDPGPRSNQTNVVVSHYQEHYQLRDALARARETERALADRSKAFTEKVRECQGQGAISRIVIEPGLEQLTLVPDRPFTIYATGTTGTPSVNLLGDPTSAVALQTKANGKQLEAVVTLKKADKSIAASLQFSAPEATSVTLPLVYFAKPAK